MYILKVGTSPHRAQYAREPALTSFFKPANDPSMTAWIKSWPKIHVNWRPPEPVSSFAMTFHSSSSLKIVGKTPSMKAIQNTQKRSWRVYSCMRLAVQMASTEWFSRRKNQRFGPSPHPIR